MGGLFLMSEVSLQVKDANVIIGDVHFDSHHYPLLHNRFVFAASKRRWPPDDPRHMLLQGPRGRRFLTSEVPL